MNISEIKEIKKREMYWMNRWLKDNIFSADRDPSKRKVFITFPYPYMNGSLHLGHAFSSGRLDVLARYYRLKGYNVLYPWAWHWTGEAVLGTIHRLLDGDIMVKKRLIELDGVDEETIERFPDPVYFVKYFTSKNREVVKRYGLSVDWSREFHTTSIHPLYNKFVEWQIRKLYKNGYITKGRYPAVWCPRDKSPTGDHDRLKGEGVRPEEYTLIKFSLWIDGEEYYLVAGTFRPETLFGVTNIWVNPDVKYVIINIDGEKWIVSSEAAYKLSNQLRRVEKIGEVKGSDLIGLYVKAPLIDKYIPILPASFVDPDMVTGIVYSVPAHAPYDYLALEDLRQAKELDPGLKEIVSWIKPVSIIKVEGYGDYPAIEEVRRLGVNSQEDYEKADIATQEVYKREYHVGVMKDNCGPVSNLPVKEAKEIIKSILFEKNMGSTMYDLPEEVICRCGTKCIVKILEDQWYLRYSDARWKELAHEAVDKMNFYPPEVKKQFHYYIDWYEDWPCTRKTGLGTPFPFDRNWIVETLTDSTIYMAFYIMSKYYNMNLINPEKIDDSFFDYIFLGEGDLHMLSKRTGLSKDLLEKIRNDFIYWYPVDIRGSGKDLVGNHLTFFIFHHVAIFPPDKWPMSISVNGYVMLNGKEMSKSKGNYISMEKAIEYVGADALRLSLLTLADGLDDPDWSIEKGLNAVNRLNTIYNFYREIFSSNNDCGSIDLHEKILLSEFYSIVRDIDEYLKRHMIANAGKLIFYKLFEVFRDYLRVSPKPNYCLLKELMADYTKLLSLYTPYLSEEIWHNIIGEENYVCIEEWPKVDEEYVDSIYLDIKAYANTIVEDIKHILSILGGKGKEINLIYSSAWKWDLLKRVQNEKRMDMKKLIKLGSEIYGIDKKDMAVYANFISREWHGRYTKFRKLLNTWSNKEESSFLKEYLIDFILSEFPNLSLKVVSEEAADNKLLKTLKKAPYPLYPSIIIK